VQIKGIYIVGAEESTALCRKKCKKYDESYTVKNFIIWSLHKYFWDDKIKKGDILLYTAVTYGYTYKECYVTGCTYSHICTTNCN